MGPAADERRAPICIEPRGAGLDAGCAAGAGTGRPGDGEGHALGEP
jgi:hypothetical protein